MNFPSFLSTSAPKFGAIIECKRSEDYNPKFDPKTEHVLFEEDVKKLGRKIREYYYAQDAVVWPYQEGGDQLPTQYPEIAKLVPGPAKGHERDWPEPPEPIVFGHRSKPDRLYIAFNDNQGKMHSEEITPYRQASGLEIPEKEFKKYANDSKRLQVTV